MVELFTAAQFYLSRRGRWAQTYNVPQRLAALQVGGMPVHNAGREPHTGMQKLLCRVVLVCEGL